MKIGNNFSLVHTFKSKDSKKNNVEIPSSIEDNFVKKEKQSCCEGLSVYNLNSSFRLKLKILSSRLNSSTTSPVSR